jgi:hypothetical protein
MDDVKKSFSRVKEDMFFLGSQIETLSFNIQELNNQILRLDDEIEKLKINFIEDKKKEDINRRLNAQNIQNNPQNQEIISPTHLNEVPTDNNIPTDNTLFKALKDQILGLSIGNGGVPTDRQTHQQTDKYIENIQNTNWRKEKEVPKMIVAPNYVVAKEDSFDKAIKVLNNLDIIKKEIRLKFKRLTEQEFKVFSVLYDLEEKGLLVDYKLLSERLSLTESSIRDYVGKLINKGIPVLKEKINNKQIILHISKDLKEITPLETIARLRDI